MKGHLFSSVLGIFFPKRCPLCDIDIFEDVLCKFCAAQCQQVAFNKDHQALFVYDSSMRDLILKAKYGHSLIHYQALSQLIDQALEKKLDAIKDLAPDSLTYVPTHWAKRALRGLDLTSMFANKVAYKLKIPLLHALKRTKLGHTQSNLKRRVERLESVEALFKLKPHIKQVSHLIIVDDITTTGATFKEAKKMLHGMSKKITCLAIAKTP
jgi:competence protein ComFC